MRLTQLLLAIIIILVIASLINWCREGYFDESIYRVIPGLGGRDFNIFDLAGIFCVSWVIYRITRRKNDDNS